MRLPTHLSAPSRRLSRAGVPAALVTLGLLLGAAPAADAAAGPWIRIDTTAQGQLATKLHEKLVSDFGQTAGSYDYSVVKKLRVTGTLSGADYTDLRSATLAGTSIQELDLSGVVDASTSALSGMTALTDVSLPPVGSYTLANPFQGNTNLRRVVVAAETYVFGSATTFNGITNLERITFLHTTKPSMNASTFAGSNNATAGSRAVEAVVPAEDRGDYDTAAFQSFFSRTTEASSTGDREELEEVIEEANALTQASAAAPYRWALLQQAITGASAILAGASPSSAKVYGARLVLQTAISRLGVSDLGLSLKVTSGADVTLSWKNGTAQHFAEFTAHPVAKVATLSDGDYDVYVPTVPVPYVTQNIASAVKPGVTDKVAKIFTMSAALSGAQYTLNLTPLAGREDSPLLIPGLSAGDNRNLYTNLDDTGVTNLEVGKTFELDTIRTQQAQLDQINNLFIEPEYTFETIGDSISTQRVGQDGRRRLRITAEQPGLSVVRITYGPLRYLTATGTDASPAGNTNWSFNGIDPQNTGLAVINVSDDVGTFDTGIAVRNELDSYYFDKTVGTRDYTFTPAAGTTVRVHDPINVSAWGTGWTSYDAASDGSFTVKLKGGRNVVELRKDGKVQYRVLRATGVAVAVTNATRPGEPFVDGDSARVSITGIEGGIEKLGGVYNPAFSAGTKAQLKYTDGAAAITSNEAPQYQTAITTFNVDVPFTGGDRALNGDMSIGGLGAEWPFHRKIPQEGKPANLAAVAIGPYRMGGMPTIYVRGAQVSTVPAVVPTPTPTPTPTATATPAVTPVPGSTSSPSPTAAAVPTAGPVPTQAPLANVFAGLAPVELTVKVAVGPVRIGTSATVQVTGLAAGEAYRVLIGDTPVAVGKATATGTVRVKLKVPAALRNGIASIRVIGSTEARAGATALRIVASKKLTVKIAKTKVSAGGTQRVTVSGLAAEESVRIEYRGKRIARLTASTKGTVSRTFPAGKSARTVTVRAYGVSDDRTGRATFAVTR